MSECASCKAPITWTQTRTGKRMPVDAEPSDDGTIRLVLAAPRTVPVAEVLTGVRLSAARDEGAQLFKSHFATCPNASEHRR